MNNKIKQKVFEFLGLEPSEITDLNYRIIRELKIYNIDLDQAIDLTIQECEKEKQRIIQDDAKWFEKELPKKLQDERQKTAQQIFAELDKILDKISVEVIEDKTYCDFRKLEKQIEELKQKFLSSGNEVEDNIVPHYKGTVKHKEGEKALSSITRQKGDKK